MRPRSATFRERVLHGQRGAALATVVLLLVLLAGVAAWLASLASVQQSQAAMDLAGVRVFQAARSGAEWGVWNAIKGTSYCTGASDSRDLAPGDLAGTLSGFAVTVACTASSHNEAGATVRYFSITATACNQGSACPPATPVANYVERQITMTVWK